MSESFIVIYKFTRNGIYGLQYRFRPRDWYIGKAGKYNCKLCDMNFISLCTVGAHVWTHFKPQFPCSLCGHKFMRNSGAKNCRGIAKKKEEEKKKKKNEEKKKEKKKKKRRRGSKHSSLGSLCRGPEFFIQYSSFSEMIEDYYMQENVKKGLPE